MFEGPCGDVHALEISYVKVGTEVEERDVAIDGGGDSLGKGSLVAWNFRRELGDELGMVKTMLFIGLQILFWGSHP